MHDPTSPASFRLPVDVRRFPWMRRLAGDYAHAYGSLASFFAGNPAEPGAWPDAIARTQAHARPRSELVSIVAAQQQRRAAPPEATASAARLGDPRSVAIVTGQQAGLFGGPLFTLLKALTAVRLAQHIEQTYRVPAVPVFWIDAEDHDWNEVSRCTVLDGDEQVRHVTLAPPQGAGSAPVGWVRLDAAIGPALDELARAMPSTEFSGWLLEGLRAAYREGATMAEAFGRWLEALLGERGLVVFDASDPAVKPLVAPVFLRELESPGRTAHLAALAGDALVAAGYHAQVGSQPSAVALFHLHAVRVPMRVQGDGTIAVGDALRQVSELQAEARVRPDAFSPNVLLRPVVQDTLFPTVSYVSGPNELAYLAQLRPVYDRFGVPMPLMWPRASMTLLDSAAARFLARHEVPLEALEPDDESTLNHLLERQLPPGVEQALVEARDAIEARMQAVIDAVPAIDATLAGAARSALGRMQHDLQALHGKVIHAAKRRDETLRRQFRHARTLAFPGGQPQERALGAVYFLNRYGPALIDRLVADLPLDVGHHWAVTI